MPPELAAAREAHDDRDLGGNLSAPDGTRILATRGTEETLLKARLLARPQHPRALASLLEAIALWQGVTVRAALAVDERDPRWATEIWPESSGTPLYSLDVVAERRRRRRDELGGLGDFRDLQKLLLVEVAR
jgi:hypothetical protein